MWNQNCSKYAFIERCVSDSFKNDNPFKIAKGTRKTIGSPNTKNWKFSAPLEDMNRTLDNNTLNSTSESRIRVHSRFSKSENHHPMFDLAKMFKHNDDEEKQDIEVIPKDASQVFVPDLLNRKGQLNNDFLDIKSSPRLTRPRDKIL